MCKDDCTPVKSKTELSSAIKCIKIMKLCYLMKIHLLKEDK